MNNTIKELAKLNEKLIEMKKEILKNAPAQPVLTLAEQKARESARAFFS